MSRSSRHHPNPYFFFRLPLESDWVTISQWMGEAGRLSDIREWQILRQVKWEFRGVGERTAGPREAAEERRLMGIVGGKLAFMLEWTVTGDVFLTGAPALHASPWRALESWGESIRYLFSEMGLHEMSVSLTPLRAAEVRALRALGCRRVKKEEDTTGEVWRMTLT